MQNAVFLIINTVYVEFSGSYTSMHKFQQYTSLKDV